MDTENFLLRLSQQLSFDEDVNQLTQNKPIQKKKQVATVDTFNRRKWYYSLNQQTRQRTILNNAPLS